MWSGVPGRKFGVIFRPYISTTSPSRLNTGITSEPLKCSCPGSGSAGCPSSFNRVRCASPAARFFAGRCRHSVRLAKPSLNRSMISAGLKAALDQILLRFRRVFSVRW